MFKELDYRETPLGDLMLRKRIDPLLEEMVYEVKLGDEFLMSSLFTEGEIELARLGLAGLNEPNLDVVVGGLGLGYTAAAVLDQTNIHNLIVVETLAEVIGWHEQAMVPLGERLSRDPRCRFVHDDFFKRALSDDGFDPVHPDKRFHAVLLDIDHSPRHWLSETHAAFYESTGLHKLQTHLHPGGCLAVWSNDPPDDDFLGKLEAAFSEATAHAVRFDNPFQNRTSMNTVYVALSAPS